MSREIDRDQALDFVRQKRSERTAAWAEDNAVMNAMAELLERLVIQNAELNAGLADARRIIKAQKAAIQTLKAMQAEERAASSP